MAETGLLVVYRPRGAWRANRGKPDVRVDGRVRGQLAAGNELEYRLSVGQHRVQVGREAMAGMSRQIFIGSPALAVLITEDVHMRVRVDPSGVPLRQQALIAESSYRLTSEGDDGASTSTPLPSDLDRYPVGAWMTNPYTRALLDRPRPWRTWQGVLSAAIVLYAARFAFALLTHHRPAGPGAWIWTALIGCTAVATLVAWASLYRVRRSRAAAPGGTASDK